MAAEICSLFGGYPSDYLKTHKIGELHFDHSLFIKLSEGEQQSFSEFQNNIRGLKSV